MPLISIEKIADGDPRPLAVGASTPLEGIRALGMGHVIAGAGIGRDLASFGADVLNLWRPDDSEIEPFYWDTAVGMRSAYLSDTGTDRVKLDELLRGADVFFSNRHPGYLEQAGLTADRPRRPRTGSHPCAGVVAWRRGPMGDTPWFRRDRRVRLRNLCSRRHPRKPQATTDAAHRRQHRRLVRHNRGAAGTPPPSLRGRLLSRPSLAHPRVSLAHHLGDSRQGIRQEDSGKHAASTRPSHPSCSPRKRLSAPTRE